MAVHRVPCWCNRARRASISLCEIACGHGDEESQHTPRRVEALVGQRVVGLDCGMEEAGVVREVRCGSDHTVVAMASGEVCTFGAGEHGRLGHGDDGRLHSPKVVEGLNL